MKSLLLAGVLALTALELASASELGATETSALLKQLADARSGQALTVRFEEKKVLPMMSEPIFEQGTMAFEPPGKFLRRTSDGNLAVSNGETLWMYYPAFAQAERYPLDQGGGPGALFSMLTQIFELRDLEKQFRVVAERIPDGFQLRLTPRSGALRRMVSDMTIELDESLRLKSSQMRGSEGDRIETSYFEEKIFSPGSTDFEFSPPPNTTVVSPMGR